MEDDKILAKIIQDYPDALLDRRKLQALFLDFFPKDRLKRNTLLMVFDDGIVNEIKTMTQIDRMTLHRFVKSVEQGYGIKTKNAENAVMAWASAVVLSKRQDSTPDSHDDEAFKKERYSDTEENLYETADSYEFENLYEYEETQKGIRILRYIDFDEPIVVIPGTVEGKRVFAVGNYAFKGCVGIEKIIISDGIEALGNGVFLNCRELKEVVLPKTLKRIGTTDPTDCPKILGSLIKYEGAFEYSAVESIEIPDSVKYIGENTFAGCGKLRRIILPDKLKEIRENTFRWCRSLLEVEFPKELDTIRISAFEGCDAMRSVELPEGVTSIEQGAFAGCKNLESIYIPDSVTEIGGGKGTGFLQTFGEPDERHEDFTILCNAGSYAMQYARAQQIKCARAHY